MADFVTRLRRVEMSGERVIELREGEEEEAAAAASEQGALPSLHEARLSLGRLGVAVAITLGCVPAYYVRRHVHFMPADELAARAEALCETYRHLWVWWAIGESELVAIGLEDVGTAPALGASRYDGENWYRGAPPLEAPGARRAAAATGVSSRWVSMQYSFARSRVSEIVRMLGEPPFAGGDESIQGRVLELKFVGGGAGRTKLGANADGPIVCVNLLWLTG